MLQAAYSGICKTLASLTDATLPALLALAQRAARPGLSPHGAQDAQASAAMQLLAVSQFEAYNLAAQGNGHVPALAGQATSAPSLAAAEAPANHRLPSQGALDAAMAGARQLQDGGRALSAAAPSAARPQMQAVAMSGEAAAAAPAKSGASGGARKRAAGEEPKGEGDARSRRKRADTRGGADLATYEAAAAAGPKQAALERNAGAAPASGAGNAISSLVSTLEEEVRCMHPATSVIINALMCSTRRDAPASLPLRC